MKLFRVACFVPAPTLHDVMTYLEGVKAYNVEVATVATKEGPKPNGPVKGRGKGQRYDKGNTILALEYLNNQDSLRAKAPEIAKYFKEQGRSHKSVSSKITEMLKTKLIKRGTGGNYEIANAGIDRLHKFQQENPQ